MHPFSLIKTCFLKRYIYFILLLFPFSENVFAQTWITGTSGTAVDLNGIHFENTNTGWAVGTNGTVIYTANGGANWNSQVSGTVNTLFAAFFTAANNGWAVGTNGTVIYTANGGANWNAQVSSTANTLLSINFSNANKGWAVGDNGTVIYTADGGANWSSQVSGTGEQLNGGYFRNTNIGWIVGNNGTVIYTANGGTNWNSQVSGTGNSLNDIYFSGANTGWAVGDGGTIIYTTNGGTNWNSQASGTGNSLNDVYFLDANNGWAVGNGGTIIYTTNGGTNWNSQVSGTTNNLYDVSFFDVNKGWASGASGIILNYTNPPVLSAIGNKNINENQLLTITLLATDADGNTLTYSSTGLPTGATFTDSTFTWTPSFSQSGAYNVTFKVSDGIVADSEIVAITVNNVNQAPVLSAIGAKSVDENQLLTVTLSASDADGTVLSYNIIGLPTGATFTDSIFSWTPSSSQSGAYNATFRVSDGAAMDSEIVAITVNNMNQAPVLAAIGAKSVNENQLLTITLSATDADGTILTYSAVGLPTGATFTDSIFSWTPSSSQSGAYNATFRVSDGAAMDSEIVAITVNNMNQAPVLAAIGAKSVNENQLLTITLSATDADGTVLSYNAVGLPTGASFTDSTFIWTPSSNQSGVYNVTFRVSDGIAVDSEIVAITVNNVNQVPVLAAIGAKSVNENQLLTITLSATDADGTILTYSAVGLPTGATFTDSIFSWTPSSSQSGAYDVTFRVSDGAAADSEQVSITVNSANGSPVITSVAPTTSSVHTVYQYNVAASDPDSDTIQYILTSAPAGMVINSSSGIITWTPSSAGSYNVTVKVSDGNLNNTQNWIITVTDNNYSPVLAPIVNQSINENNLLTITLSATDADGDGLTYSAANLPEGATLSGDIFNWTPNYEQAGSYSVTFVASDGKSSDSKSIDITVIDVNRPPVLSNIENKTIYENQTVNITVSGRDPEGNTLIYSTANLPEGATFAGNKFTWTPSFQQAGSYTITFTVSDGNTIDSKSLTITVLNVNHVPVLSAIGNKTINENQPVTITLLGTDADGDSRTYSIINLPVGANFKNNIFTWTPDYSQAGIYMVTFKISDSAAVDSEQVTITVNNVNRKPVISSSAPTFSFIDSIYKYTITASDPDNDALKFILTSAPKGMKIDSSTGEIIWIPSTAGSYNVTVKVSDGNLLDTQSWKIKVFSVNHPPALAPVGGKIIDENQLLAIILSGTDKDGDTLTYSVSNLPEGAGFKDSIFTWTPDYLQAGIYTVTFKLTDDAAVDSEQVTITVNNVDRQPTITSSAPTTSFVDSLYQYTVKASDGDGDTVYFNLGAAPSGMGIDSVTGMITWTPSTAGIYNVTVKISSGNLTNVQNWKIEVLSINHPPTLIPIGSKDVDENNVLSITSSGTDKDSDLLTYSVANLPAGASFKDSIFTWTPDYSQAGSYTVTFRISDSAAVDSEIVTITVNNVNRPPIIISHPTTSGLVDNNYTYLFEAEDPDGDVVSYSLKTAPEGMKIDSKNGIITWTHGLRGTFEVSAVASDGTLQEEQSWIINVGSINTSAILESIGNPSVIVNDPLTITLPQIDSNGDSLFYSIINIPDHAILEDNIFSYTPDSNNCGCTEIILEVSTKWGIQTLPVNIDVFRNNDSLINIPSNSITFNEDSVFEVNLNKYVPERANVINFKFKITASEYIRTNFDTVRNVLKIFPKKDWSGEDKIVISVQCKDKYCFDSDSISINILPVNDPPGEFELLHPTEQIAEIDTLFRWSKSSNVDFGDSIRYTLGLLKNNSLLDTAFLVKNIADTFYVLNKSLKKKLTQGEIYKIILYAEDNYGGRTSAKSKEASYKYLDPQSDQPATVPVNYCLYQNYPNPFNAGTTIKFDLLKKSLVNLKIFNMLGQQIKTLVKEQKTEGSHSVYWDGTNDSGIPVPSGVYIYWLKTDVGFIKSKKMVYVK